MLLQRRQRDERRWPQPPHIAKVERRPRLTPCERCADIPSRRNRAKIHTLAATNTVTTAGALALISHAADLSTSNRQPISARPVATSPIRASADSRSTVIP